MLSENDKKTILSVYQNPEHGLSIPKTYNYLKPQYTLSQIKEALKSEESVQTSKKTKNQKSYFHIATNNPGEFQCDLMFMDQKYKKFNGGMNVFLVIINVMNRFLYLYPMNNKKSENIVEALEEFLKYAREKPSLIVCDAGSEFISKKVGAYLERNDIKMVVVNKVENEDSHATALVERVIRTIREMLGKYMEVYKTNKYQDKIDEIVANYNNSPHRGLGGEAPAEVTVQSAQEINDEISKLDKGLYEKIMDIEPGQKVRLLVKRKGFEKGGDSWSKTVHEIESVEGNHFTIKGKNRPYLYREIQVIDSVNERPDTTAEDELKKEKKRNQINRRLKKEGLEIQV